MERRDPASNDLTMRRYFDPRLERYVVKVLPGEFYISDRSDEVIVTVLGSCVAACVRDPLRRVAGLNHFMLPEGSPDGWKTSNAAMRYGRTAMSTLIAEICRRGGRPEDLEVKLFGGADVAKMASTVGTNNAGFAERYCQEAGIPVAALDLAGVLPRRIVYYPDSGRVQCHYLRRRDDVAIFDAEGKLAPTPLQPIRLPASLTGEVIS